MVFKIPDWKAMGQVVSQSLSLGGERRGVGGPRRLRNVVRGGVCSVIPKHTDRQTLSKPTAMLPI